MRGEIVLTTQGREHSEIIQAGQMTALAAGLPRGRSVDLGEKDYGIKVDGYAAAGVEAYLIADPFRALCTPHTGAVAGRYPAPTTHPFGEVVTLGADDTEFVLDTDDWPRIG